MNLQACTKVCREIKVHTNARWLKQLKVRGMVIGKHVFFSQDRSEIPEWLWRHELEHCYQIIREGTFRFYLKYFFYSVTRGYANNPFEVEAHRRQVLPLNPHEEEMLCRLKGVYPPLRSDSITTSRDSIS